jgi:Protein of unknown function with HXXEE motif
VASMSRWSRADPSRIVLLAPLLFGVHVLEEAPGFVRWFNSLVQRGISWDLFLAVNVMAFLITLLVAGVAATAPSRVAMLVAVGWLGFLMFANAVLHLAGTAMHGRYSPGVVTATLLYLPYFGWLTSLVHRRYNIALPTLFTTTVVAGLPMFVHGYLILFRGSRLF